MMSREFTMIIERDPESGWLVGSIAELPGCYTQAPDMAQLESSIREAIQVYLETVAEEDIEPFSDFVGLQRLEVFM
jgi:predicted RNase H-like HicB family nuclease